MNQCEYVTRTGKRCRRRVIPGRRFCWQHESSRFKRITSIIVALLPIIGLVADLKGLGLWPPFSSEKPPPIFLDTDPIPEINEYMRELLREEIPLYSLQENATVVYVKRSIENICKGSQDINRAISAVRAFTSPENPEIFRMVAVAVLVELSQEYARGGVQHPKSGFLRGLDLSGLNLTQCDFSYADPREVSFADTNLEMCRFDNTDFSNASFLRTKMDSALIGQATFEGATFKSSSFNKAIIAESNMSKVSFEHCSFQDATIFASDFQESHFLQCNFHNTNIIADDFSNVGFFSMHFEMKETCNQGTGVDFSTAKFAWEPTQEDDEKPKTIFFPSLNLFSFEFPPQSITSFAHSILKFANFSRTCLQGLKFVNSELQGANFEGADLLEADFQGANIECDSFQNADVQNALHLNVVSSMRQADFRGVAATRDFLTIEGTAPISTYTHAK